MKLSSKILFFGFFVITATYVEASEIPTHSMHVRALKIECLEVGYTCELKNDAITLDQVLKGARPMPGQKKINPQVIHQSALGSLYDLRTGKLVSKKERSLWLKSLDYLMMHRYGYLPVKIKVFQIEKFICPYCAPDRAIYEVVQIEIRHQGKSFFFRSQKFLKSLDK